MKLGYPCLNTLFPKRCSRTFRLASYSEQRLIETVDENLRGLEEILDYNRDHGFLHFRIVSGIVPFASHPVCQYPWQAHYADWLARIGAFAREHDMRLSFHPDQFVLINATDEKIFENSVRELAYQCEFLDLMGMDATHKVQLHVGGIYGDQDASIQRFIERFHSLPEAIRRRLVIENDDRLYSLRDCLRIHEPTGIPILFDVFHHLLNHHGESVPEAFRLFTATWRGHGNPMVDYSSQEQDKRVGTHATSIVLDDFRRFLDETLDFDFDLMLEIKDKEQSALKALELLQQHPAGEKLIAPVRVG